LLGVLERVGGRGRRGSAGLRAFLRHSAPEEGITSALEQALHDVLLLSGLGRPDLQHELRCVDGRLVRLDAAYPDRRLAVEADGHRWHGTSAQLRSDLARSRAIQASGWTHLRFGWSDLHERRAATLLELRRLANP
jgi:very-short-patch-repair endonuclease